MFGGLTREQAAAVLGVSLRSIGNWERGKARPPYAAFKLLRVLRHGDFVDPRWSGYRIIRGKLVTPEDREFSPVDLSWLSLLARRADAFTAVLNRLKESDRSAGAGTRPSACTTAAAAALDTVDLHAATAVVQSAHTGAMPLKPSNDGFNNKPPPTGVGTYTGKGQSRDQNRPFQVLKIPPPPGWGRIRISGVSRGRSPRVVTRGCFYLSMPTRPGVACERPCAASARYVGLAHAGRSGTGCVRRLLGCFPSPVATGGRSVLGGRFALDNSGGFPG